MNSIHNNGENDQTFNGGLDKLGQAYKQLEQDEPPELLDQAILNSAHRAVEKKPHWMKFGWLHGLTTAAVFVLAFSVILNQREPVAVFENGVRSNEPAGLQRERALKKQSAAPVLSEDSRMEMNVKSERRQDMLQSMPVAAAPQEMAKESAAFNEAEEAELNVQSSLYIHDDLHGETDGIDKDVPARSLMAEEKLISKTGSMADITDEKLQLLAIIKLKQNGDERWKTELESFKEKYPDYPLPNELKIP